jgi:hypothetical protein
MNQFCKKFVQQVSMDIVDFFMTFNEWHCGLNQLKKFNQQEFQKLDTIFS